MELVIRLAMGLLMLLHWVYSFFKSLMSTEKRKSVAACDDYLLNLTALTLAQKIRERKVFSQEVVHAYIKRIKQVNPIINAIVEDRFKGALEEAKEIDRYLDNNRDKVDELKVTKPLLGVPITVKEAIAVKGLSHTGCTITRKNIKADKDSVVVQYLKEAGVIPLLVSTTPEYCGSLSTYNKITGHTYNPYNTLCTSGGSSGGEGALLGAGASLLGVGSDIAGSIRLPAMYNGIFGHKPTSKVVSLEGHWPLTDEDVFQSALVIGPLTRYAEDLKPLLKIMSGPNAQALRLDEEVDLSKIVVFYMEDCGNNFCLPTVDKEIQMAIKTAVTYLSKECHCRVSNYKFKKLDDTIEMTTALLARLTIPTPLRDTEVKYNVCLEIIRDLFGKSVFSTRHLLLVLIDNVLKYFSFNTKKYISKSDELAKDVETMLGNTGVLIYPCLPTSASIVGDIFIEVPTLIYNTFSNLIGTPATAVPAGFNSRKMPIGIQVIAARNQDRLSLAVAQELEKCFGGWQAVP